MTKSVVDNSGRGNCMYYSYAISLMYFLRDAKDNRMTEIAFNNLKLDEPQKKRLTALLKKNRDFNDLDIEQIIEPILGPATRALGAERTRQEYLAKPDNSPIFTSAAYGIEYVFKQQLVAKQSRLAECINNNFSNETMIAAEIYNTPGIKAGMRDFAARQIDDFIADFDARWEEERKTLRKNCSENELNFHRSQILDAVVREKTITFFAENDHDFLNKYIERLNTDLVWGSEETMFALHRAVIGEKMVRNPETDLIQTTYDMEIPLVLFQNGRAAVDNRGKAIPDQVMILNNIRNIHWVSLVQLNRPGLTPSVQKTRASGVPESSNPSSTQRKSNAPTATSTPAINQLPEAAASIQGIPAQSGLSMEQDKLIEEQQLRKNILYLSGFTLYLEMLQDKAGKLKDDGYANESILANNLAKNLQDGIDTFTYIGSEQSRDEDMQAFAGYCTSLTKDALNSKLAHHRGVKGVLNAIANLVASICTLGLINWSLGKLTIVEPFATKSAETINELQNSVVTMSQYTQRFFASSKAPLQDASASADADAHITSEHSFN